MKVSNLTYYLLTILCMVATSCVSDGVMDNCPDISKSQVQIEGGKMNIVLTFPASSTRSATNRASTDDGIAAERTIDDIHIYTFQNDKFIEDIEYIVINGKNGDISRVIEGTLSGTYSSSVAMDYVVIVNAENKGVNNVNMYKGANKAALYKQLVFNYEKSNNWSEYIPMWGEGSITQLKEGENNVGTLTLRRAIAKVNVTVNSGMGVPDFEIKEIQLHNYTTQGYCAPTKQNGPSIPATAVISDNSLTSGILSGTEGNRFVNRFYIPEHQNVGVESDKATYLTIKAIINGNFQKTYTLSFTKNNAAYNVLRNNVYVFNIKSVKTDAENTLEYEVKSWDEVEVIIPPFS